MFSGLHNFCTILNILPNFAHLTQFGTFMHYLIFFALFFFKFCKILHIFNNFAHFALIVHFHKNSTFCTNLHIIHNFAYFAKFCINLLIVNNCSNWLKEMVEFSKKIDQGGAKSGQYLHPIYITSVWVHSVHVLKMNIAITTTKIIKKGKQKMRKMAVIWLVLSLVDVLWRWDSYNMNIYWHLWFGPISSNFLYLELSFGENSFLSLTRCIRGTN